MDSYLKEFHSEDITDLLNDNNNLSQVAVNVNLSHLKIHRPELYSEIIINVWEVTAKWDKALFEIQKQLVEGNAFLEPDFQIKENCHVRFTNLPESDNPIKSGFPSNDHVGLFVQIKGNVVRMSQNRLLEFKKEYVCTRCKQTFIIEAEYENMFVFQTPRGCKNPLGNCKGTLQVKNTHPKPEYCMDYQEIRIQEHFLEKNVRAAINATLENDLMGICQPGDNVTVCGTVNRRWRPFVVGKRSEIVLSLRTLSVCKEEKKVVFAKDTPDQILCVRSQWQDAIDQYGELDARDILVQSICPEVHGMYLIKLAIALSMCSGIARDLNGGVTTRGQSHLLLVGDPGLAKSKLLKAAAKIAIHAVHTTGMGCSAAGLTAAAVKEGGEWQLEAGALVVADGGICCIDEFNLMRESDKASIHEAMEQQTISMAKVGLVCKLSTRCGILAATNPKNLHNMSEIEGTSSVNIGIAPALLSRFDLVFILRDDHNAEWDSKVTDHLLNTATESNNSTNLWDLQHLQSHFLAVQNINPKPSALSNTILGTYYKYCRSDEFRDPTRTTVRLLESLNRLSEGHAKLLFRDYVTSIDAIVVVRLMESSWGFGRMIKPINLLKTELPFGPNEEEIREVLQILNLSHLEEKVIQELNNFHSTPVNKTIPKNSEEYQKKSDYSSLSPKKIETLSVRVHEISKRNAENDSSILKVHDLENAFGYKKNMKKLRTNSPENKENENLKSIFENSVNNSLLSIETKNHFFASTQVDDARKQGINDWCSNFSDFPDEDSSSESYEVGENSVETGKTLENTSSLEQTKIKVTKETDFENFPSKIQSNVQSPHASTSKDQLIVENSNDKLKTKVSPATVKKLGMFRNPNFMERNSTNEVRPIENECESKPIEQNSESACGRKNNDHDSAYNTMSTNARSFNSSFVMYLKDEDLSCLDFDI